MRTIKCQTEEMLDRARALMHAEADSIRAAAERLNSDFGHAAGLLAAHSGKVVLTGLGKSGRIAEKLAATFCSTGTRAVFLHAAEALHGDLGILERGDPVIAVSKSGATPELISLLPRLREWGCPLIAILGQLDSPLARAARVVLDGSVAPQADPMSVPASSAIVALSLGHALALATAELRGFSQADFALLHPGGQIGRLLTMRVEQAMHTGSDVAWVSPSASLREVIVEMSRHPLGAACVMDNEEQLTGLITDGDLRRAIAAHDDIRTLCAADIMTRNPVTIAPGMLLESALELMENRTSQISVLPVLDSLTSRCLGLLRIHDIFSAKV